jgi:hypothetical protein
MPNSRSSDETAQDDDDGERLPEFGPHNDWWIVPKF